MLFSAVTYFMAIIAVLGWCARIVPPEKSWLITFVGLGMSVVLVINFIFMVVWAIKRNWQALIPLAAILLNFGYIASMVQVDFRAKSKLPPCELKVATYNIHGQNHKDFKGALTEVVNFFDFEKVDLFCLQEFCNFKRSESEQILTHFPYFEVRSPYSGMQLAVFSKYPIINAKLISFKGTANCAMLADIDVSGQIVRVINVHFQTTSINQSGSEISKVKNLGLENPDGKRALDMLTDRMLMNAYQRSLQVDMVKKQIQNRGDKLILVCGDFNDVPSSYTYHSIKAGLEDGFRSCGKGYASTFSPMYHLLRIDYILHDKAFKGIRYYSPKANWSDHNPVIIELAFDKQATHKKK